MRAEHGKQSNHDPTEAAREVAQWLVRAASEVDGVDLVVIVEHGATGPNEIVARTATAAAATVARLAAAAEQDLPIAGWTHLPSADQSARLVDWPDAPPLAIAIAASDAARAWRTIDALVDFATTVSRWVATSSADRRTVAQLEDALDRRVTVEQAKGYLTARAAVPVERSFEIMRARARMSNRRLDDVAREVLAGEALATTLTEQAMQHVH